MLLIKKLNLPKPWFRNIKTALSVFFCILLFELIDRPNPLFACSAAIICMRETVDDSFKTGVDRVVGTLIGGIIGLVFLLIKNHLNMLSTQCIIGGIGVFVAIYLCNVFNKNNAAVISSIVVLAIIIGVTEKPPYLYALDRTVDTLAGIIIALLVNKYIYPWKEENSAESEP